MNIFTGSAHSCFSNYEVLEKNLSICLDICLLQPLTQVAWKGSVVSQDRQKMCSFPGFLSFTLNELKYLGYKRWNGFYTENQTLKKTNTLHIHKSRLHNVYELFHRKQT